MILLFIKFLKGLDMCNHFQSFWSSCLLMLPAVNSPCCLTCCLQGPLLFSRRSHRNSEAGNTPKAVFKKDVSPFNVSGQHHNTARATRRHMCASIPTSHQRRSWEPALELELPASQHDSMTQRQHLSLKRVSKLVSSVSACQHGNMSA